MRGGGPPRREYRMEEEKFKEDKDKPMISLVNPMHVPKGRSYFEVSYYFAILY